MSGTEEDTENISAPRDKSLDQHWEPWTLGHRSQRSQLVTTLLLKNRVLTSRNVGIRENRIFGIFEGSRTVEKQKQNTQPFTATNQRA